VPEELAEWNVVPLVHRCIDAGGGRRELDQAVEVLLPHFQVLGDLPPAGVAPQRLPQVGLRPADVLELLRLGVRDAYERRSLRQRPQDQLPDPPDGIGDEPRALVRIVTAGRLDQAEVSFVQQILEGQPEMPVLAGDRDDETEVRFNEPIDRVLSTVREIAHQTLFLRLGKKWNTPNLPKVPGDHGCPHF